MKLFLCSIFLNVAFFCLFVVLCFYKRSALKARFERYFLKVKPTDTELLDFNHEPFEASNGVYGDPSNKKIKILFLGNSLTYCGVAEGDPDKTLRGLTSTNIQKDYVHVLMKLISQNKNVCIQYSILNIADFERGFKEYSFQKASILNAQVRDPDYLIVQIGENVENKNIDYNKGGGHCIYE